MIRAVIFDWAGTTIDYGNQAPVLAIRKAFQQFGLQVGRRQLYQSNGVDPLTRIQQLLSADDLKQAWYIKHPDIDVKAGAIEIYKWFNRDLIETLPQVAKVKAGIPTLISYLRTQDIRFATTSVYTAPMLSQVLPLASEQGFDPQINITAEDVEGVSRPCPDMLNLAIDKLRIRDCHSVIQVGDTPADILAGQAAGVTTVGIIEGSSLIGLSEEEFSHLPFAKRNSLNNEAAAKLQRAGADYIVQNAKDLMRLIKELDSEKIVS